MKKLLGDRIKHYRELRGMTQKALADVLKIDKGTVWRWEGGRSWPDYDSLMGIAATLEINPEQLFETIGKTPPPITVEQALEVLAREVHKPKPPKAALLKAADKLLEEMASDAPKSAKKGSKA